MSLELLALGVQFMGGLMGQQSANKDRRENALNRMQAQRQFDAQMDQSVQRRVKDARKAGVHPLFALGASVGASPTISAQGGQNSGNPMGAALNAMASTLNSLETNRAKAARDHAEAQLLDSERKRIEQDLQHRGAGSGVRTFPLPEDSVYKPQGVVLGDAEYVSPQVKKSQRPGVVSGTNAGRIEVMTETGQVYTLPNPDLGLDEVGQIEFVMGLPGRMWNDVTNHRKKSAEVRKLDAELTRLRNLRENPDKAREARALADRINRKISNWYKKARKYF